MPYLLRGQHWEQALDILMFAQRSNLQRKSGTAGAGAGAFFNVEHQLELYNVSISACQKWLGGLGHLNPTMGTPTTGGWVVFPGIPRCLPKYLASGIVFAAVMIFEWFIIKVSAFVGVWRKKRIFRGGHCLSFFMSPSMGSVGESCSQTGARSAAVTREAMESCPSTFAENAARKSARQCQNLQCCHSSLGRLGGFEAWFLLLLDDLFFFVKLVL